MGLIFSIFQKAILFFNSHSLPKENEIEADVLNSHCDTKEIELEMLDGSTGLGTIVIVPIPDRISELPDDILASFVSQLSLKEVARLSVLSHRWRYPWKLSNRLDFENDSVNAEKIWLNESDKLNFVKWVNQVLESHDTTKLEHVRISYGLDKCFKSDLDRWLKIVFSKQVQSFDLGLQLRDITNMVSKTYTLTRDIFSQNDATGLVNCQFIGFKSLKSLRLSKVLLSDELVEFFLDNCPNLERLYIRAGSQSLANFKLTGKHHALRFLELRCDFLSIEISDVNLVSFTCHACLVEPKLVIKNVPSLVNLHLSNSMAGSYLSSRMNDVIAQLSCSLKSLILCLPLDLGYPDIRRLPELTALEELVVQKTEPTNFIFPYYELIKMCPNLQKFEFQGAWAKNISLGDGDIYRRRLNPSHQCLKEVKLAGYYGCDRDVESAFYFFDNAVVLEKVIIDPHNQKRIFYGVPKRDYETRRERAARERAKKQLKGKAPQRVQLVIL